MHRAIFKAYCTGLKYLDIMSDVCNTSLTADGYIKTLRFYIFCNLLSNLFKRRGISSLSERLFSKDLFELLEVSRIQTCRMIFMLGFAVVVGLNLLRVVDIVRYR